MYPQHLRVRSVSTLSMQKNNSDRDLNKQHRRQMRLQSDWQHRLTDSIVAMPRANQADRHLNTRY